MIIILKMEKLKDKLERNWKMSYIERSKDNNYIRFVLRNNASKKENKVKYLKFKKKKKNSLT